MRKTLTVTAIAAFVAGGAFLSAGTASATQQVVSTSCTGTVTGQMGDQVAIDGGCGQDPGHERREQRGHPRGRQLGRRLHRQGPRRSWWARCRTPRAAKSPARRSARRSAPRWRNSGTWGLGFDWNKTLNSVESTVAKGCGLTLLAGNYVAPSTPGQSGGGNGTAPGNGVPASDGASGNLSNLNPGAAGGTGGSAPMRDYSGIPTATAGTAVAPGVRYPANGTLPGDASAPQAGPGDQSGQGADIRDAGNAQSLASPGSSNDVQLPMLLAVIVLAGVTAGLVRTWVLRRAS